MVGVVVSCFVKSRNGFLVRLWFFFLESNTSRGSLVVLVEFIYVASFVVCEFEEFFEWVSLGRACGFLLCCGFFFVLLVRQDRYLAVLIWEEILRCPTGGVAFPSFCSKGKGLWISRRKFSDSDSQG